MLNSTARILWTDLSNTAHTNPINDRLSSDTQKYIRNVAFRLVQLSRLISATTIVVLADTSSR